MRRRVTALLVVACLVCSSVLAQQSGQSRQQPRSVSQLPQNVVEPFKIGRGTTFSASVPRSAQNAKPANAPASAPKEQIVEDLNEALRLIEKNHVNGRSLNYNQLTKSTITAMLRALDPHSNFFDASSYRDLLQEQRSEYSGIGATIVNYTFDGVMETFVTSTFPNSPAQRAGLNFGDKIVAVNGEKMSGKTSFYVRDQIRGDKGKVVRLAVERNLGGKIETIEIRRNIVPQPSIPDAYLLRPGIGYIDLTNGFNYTTKDELEVALRELSEQGMTSLILDLRDNPGGILLQAVRVAEKFLSFGQTIVSQRGRFAIDNRTFRSTNRNPETLPLVVLVNGGSASASEIVAGALQDYDRALIVGENTFGKGLVQSVLNLPFGTGLALTTAKYYTPSGRLIQRDYSAGNLYDYYRQKVNLDNRKKLAGKTITGRTVFGGNGIEPDETVPAPVYTPQQVELLDSIFFFTREVTAGRIRKLENYRLTRQPQYGMRVQASDLPPSDELFKAFMKFMAENPKWNRPAEQIEAQKDFILLKLKFNLATALFGNVAAAQVLIEEDPQVAKAVELLPRAQNLALAAQKSLQRLNR